VQTQTPLYLIYLAKFRHLIDCTRLKIQVLPPPLTLLAVVVVLHRGAKIAGMMTVVAKTGGVMIAHAIVRMVAVEVVVTAVATKAVVTVGMRIAAVMMIAHITVMMEIGVMMVHAVVIASLLGSLTLLAKYAQFMVTLQKTVGGVMRRIVIVVTMVIVAARMQTLPLMELIQTGIMILVLLITSLVN
jgi:hypothetical protein